jgi:hypothetical protein
VLPVVDTLPPLRALSNANLRTANLAGEFSSLSPNLEL